jgi:hypothetical protein
MVLKKGKITACHTMHKLDDMDHLSHSAKQTPNDFHLFGPLQKHLAGNWFAANTNVQYTVISWLKALDVNFFHARTDALVSWWHKCLDISGDCGKVMCMKVFSCACIYVRIKSHRTACYLTISNTLIFSVSAHFYVSVSTVVCPCWVI